MKRKRLSSNIFVLAFALAIVATMPTSALALSLNFSSIGDAEIVFTGTGDTFTFNDDSGGGTTSRLDRSLMDQTFTQLACWEILGEPSQSEQSLAHSQELRQPRCLGRERLALLTRIQAYSQRLYHGWASLP